MPAESFIHRLAIGSRYDELAGLGGWLDAITSACQLPAPVAYHIDLVLTEAVTNVMDYAAEHGSERRIELTCACRENAVWLDIMDDGPAFDPTRRAEVDLPTSLEAAVPGGLGVHLMRKYTSAMHYRHENGHNVLTLVVPNPSSSPAGPARPRPDAQ